MAIIHLDRPDICALKFFNLRIQNGRKSALFTSIGLISGKPCWIARPLYYKTKCDVSGEDAFQKLSTQSNSKWPPIGHYLLSHGRYLVNRVR